MERIFAASNLIIEMQPERWRLLVNGNETERVLVEAVPGQPLRYLESFGSRRRLPETGTLPRDDIQRVVLGWSEKDTAWHLGLVLKGDLVTQRGSRWCGLAHWYDPKITQYQTVAMQAGQTLAQQITRPFTVIPPSETAPPPTAEATAPALDDTPARGGLPVIEEAPAEPIPQPDLPLKFDLWSLHPAEGQPGLELILSRAFGRSKLIRVAWNIIWLGVFIVLTLTTLTSGIALPRPEFLVYLGFASIAVLVIAIFYGLYQSATYLNRVVITAEGVRWLRGRGSRRFIEQSAIQEVYVSHVIDKAGKHPDREVRFGEITLRLKDDHFETVLIEPQPSDRIPLTDDALNEDAIVPLTEYNARTQMQSAGLKIAQVLDVPAEYDKRLK